MKKMKTRKPLTKCSSVTTGATPGKAKERRSSVCSSHEDDVRKPGDGIGLDTTPLAPVLDHETSQRRVKEEKEEKVPDSSCQYVAWVQCANHTCRKWRRLRDQEDPWLLPRDWSCNQITDGVHDRCDVAEESCSGPHAVMIYAEYVPGSVVWVKQVGHPWWPAIVDYDPDARKYCKFPKSEDSLPSKYHVTFLGESVSRAWVSGCHLRPFQQFLDDSRGKVKNPRIRRELVLSIDMAQRALSLGLRGRLQRYGFSARYMTGEEEGEGQGAQPELLPLTENPYKELSDDDLLPVMSEGKDEKITPTAIKRLMRRKKAPNSPRSDPLLMRKLCRR